MNEIIWMIFVIRQQKSWIYVENTEHFEMGKIKGSYEPDYYSGD